MKSSKLSTSGVTEPIALYTCARIEPPRRNWPLDKSIRTSTESSRFLSSGVKVLRTSNTGANAVITPVIGEVTALSSPSFQVVRIESESLPTGIAMPNAGHISIPIAFTPSNKA